MTPSLGPKNKKKQKTANDSKSFHILHLDDQTALLGRHFEPSLALHGSHFGPQLRPTWRYLASTLGPNWPHICPNWPTCTAHCFQRPTSLYLTDIAPRFYSFPGRLHVQNCVHLVFSPSAIHTPQTIRTHLSIPLEGFMYMTIYTWSFHLRPFRLTPNAASSLPVNAEC